MGLFSKKDSLADPAIADPDLKVDPQHINEAPVYASDGWTYVPDTPEEAKLVRKIDLHLLPILWVMYIMNYVSDPGATGRAPT